MRLEPARRAAPSPLLAAPLLLAVAAACAFPASADPEPGGVAIALTAADVDGRPHRLHGDFSFASVDGGVVRSVSTRSGGPHRGARASGDDPDVLEVQLPPGRYALSLDADFVVEDLGPCQRTATASRPAWVNPVHPPLVDVAAEQVTRVHFELASANRVGRPGASPSARPSPAAAAGGALSTLTRSGESASRPTSH